MTGQRRLACNRDLATPAERSQESPFCSYSDARRDVVERLKKLPCLVIRRSAHNSQRALTCSGEHNVVIKNLRHPPGMSKPLQTRNGQNDSVKLSGVQLAQARVHISA